MYRILSSAMGYDAGQSGISEYMDNTIRILASEHKVDLIISESDSSIFPADGLPNLKLLKYPDQLSKPAVNMLWHLFVLPFTIDFKKYDFIFLPAANRRLFCRYPIPSIATVHDLSQFHVKGKYDVFRTFYIKKTVPLFLKKIQCIMAVSNSTGNDITKYFGIDKNKITVNHNGYSPGILDGSPADFKAEWLNPDKKYILYVARIEHPGKNHMNLIKAYEKLPKKIKNEYELVLAGRPWNRSAKVTEYAEASEDREKIHFTGFLPDQELRGLYMKASIFVFPSFFEGFGLPLLEAMAAGLPTACSNTSSLPEVGGDAVLTFDPAQPDDISSKIMDIVNNEPLREKLIKKGKKRLEHFSWKKHCETIIKTYESKTGKDKPH